MWTNELSNQSIYVYIFFLCKSFANGATFQMADEQRAVPVLEFGEILNPAISDLLIASVLYWPRGDQNRLGLKEHCFVCWTGELVNDSGNTYSNLSVENKTDYQK
jgi:hypothetical protein